MRRDAAACRTEDATNRTFKTEQRKKRRRPPGQVTRPKPASHVVREEGPASASTG